MPPRRGPDDLLKEPAYNLAHTLASSTALRVYGEDKKGRLTDPIDYSVVAVEAYASLVTQKYRKVFDEVGREEGSLIWTFPRAGALTHVVADVNARAIVTLWEFRDPEGRPVTMRDILANQFGISRDNHDTAIEFQTQIFDTFGEPQVVNRPSRRLQIVNDPTVEDIAEVTWRKAPRRSEHSLGILRRKNKKKK